MNSNHQNKEQTFTHSKKELEFYEKMEVPPPTLDPDQRQQLRLVWRNERVLHKRKCDATGKSILSVFHPDTPLKVYEPEYWYSAEWDAKDYGQEFDFSRPFFEQFKSLLHKVPQLARSIVNNQNCDYVNQCGWCKDCYLIFEADHNEKCLYSNNIYDSRYSMDCMNVTNCELCYECVDCIDSYNLKYSQNSKNCSDSWFLKNCIGCKNCFGCINLRNKEYYFLNEKLTKEEYEKKVASIKKDTPESLEKARNKFLDFSQKFPHRYMEGTQNEDSTGNYLYNTQRCTDCYDVHNSQDCAYVYNCRNMKMCHDITVFGSEEGADFCYNCHEIGAGVRNIRFSDQIWQGCYEIDYSKLCTQNSHHLFGCIGLKHQSYCILNKQYSEDEYHTLRNKIIEHMKETGEWGQYFPYDLCPYAYNETIAQFYYPLTKQEAEDQGYRWRDPEQPQDSSDAIICKATGKPFKPTKLELQFYEKFNLPTPQYCPDERHMRRFKLRNPRKLYKRKCAKNNTDILTTYSPERKEPIYSKEAYLDEVN